MKVYLRCGLELLVMNKIRVIEVSRQFVVSIKCLPRSGDRKILDVNSRWEGPTGGVVKALGPHVVDCGVSPGQGSLLSYFPSRSLCLSSEIK